MKNLIQSKFCSPKIYLLLLVFVFTFSITHSQNLLSNPGFENWSGSQPDSWEVDGSYLTLEQSTSTVHNGNYAVKLTWTSEGTQQLVQSIPVAGNSDYQVSGWLYDDDSGGRARIYVRWNDNSGGYISNSYPTSPDYTTDQINWQEFNDTYTSPENAAEAIIRIALYDVSGWPGFASVYADDISFEGGSVTPVINKAYSVSNDEIHLFYSADLSSVDPADYLLSGSDNITFSQVFIDATNPKLVHLANPSQSIVSDIIVDEITDSEYGTSYQFYAGITPISFTNTNNPQDHIDNEILASFRGIVSANDNYNNVWLSDNSGAYNGVLIYDYDFTSEVIVGDEIVISAVRDVYSNVTELKNPTLINLISSGNEPYPALNINGADIDSSLAADQDPAEKFEGQLVRIENSYIEVAPDTAAGQYYAICSDNGGSNYFYVGDQVDYQFNNIVLEQGTTETLIGVVDWDYQNKYYRLNPRQQADVPVDMPSGFQDLTNLTVNKPNPVNDHTKISFYSKTSIPEKIKIYNISGQLIKVLIPEDTGTYEYSTRWNCTNLNNKPVASGIYFYKVITASSVFSQKMLIIR